MAHREGQSSRTKKRDKDVIEWNWASAKNSTEKSVFETEILDQEGGPPICWAISTAAVLEGSFNIKLDGEHRVKASVQELLDYAMKTDEMKISKLPLRAANAWRHINSHDLAQADEYDDFIGEPQLSNQMSEMGKGIRLKIHGSTEVVRELDLATGWMKKVQDKNIVELVKQHPLVGALEMHHSYLQWDLGQKCAGSRYRIYGGPTQEEERIADLQRRSGNMRILLHAVVIVGYGVDKSGDDEIEYFIIRNSYGEEWGKDGYGRIIRNRLDRPSVFVAYSYPNIDTSNFPKKEEE